VPKSDNRHLRAKTLAIWLRPAAHNPKNHPPWLDESLSSQREPVFNVNAPWPALAIAASIIAGYFLQSLWPQDQVLMRWGYSPARGGTHLETLITAIFLHGSWAHAGMNALVALAFAAPVCRYFGTTARGFGVFMLFYVLCGALGNVAFGLLYPKAIGPLVGASGAVSALAAGAARIVAGQGKVGPILSPMVLGMGGGWVITNLLVAVLGFSPGAGGAQVAWEVHLAGFAAGLLLIQPLGRLVGRAHAD
jgi:membrane associated rhomboid family serine protease